MSEKTANKSVKIDEFSELTSLCEKLITLMAHNKNEIVVEELANLYALCLFSLDVLINYNQALEMGEEGSDAAHFLGFDFSEKMAFIDDKLKELSKNGISLSLN